MNRREKRLMEKKFGLLKAKRDLANYSIYAWSEEVAKNIEAGNRKQDEMRELRRLQESQFKDKIDSQKISSMTTTLMIEEKLDYTSAYQKAKEIYEREIAEEKNATKTEKIKNSDKEITK